MYTFKTSPSREKILSRIRSGLENVKLSMPFPEAEQESLRDIYSYEDLLPEELFAQEFIKLGGKFVFCENEKEFLDNVDNLFDARGWTEIVCAEPHILQMFRNNRIGFVHEADPSNNSANACITGCETLVGRTGSVIVSSRQTLGRIAPVYYPVHIIVAYAHQVVMDIKDSFGEIKERYGKDLPSMINLNTGPSRTADIEKTLVVGVHGPGEVFCFFIND